MSISVGLISGRHQLPVNNYIIDKIDNVNDFVEARKKVNEFLHTNFEKPCDDTLIVYVTGLTYVTAELVHQCTSIGIDLTLMHYDISTGLYSKQCFKNC